MKILRGAMVKIPIELDSTPWEAIVRYRADGESEFRELDRQTITEPSLTISAPQVSGVLDVHFLKPDGTVVAPLSTDITVLPDPGDQLPRLERDVKQELK